MRFLPSKEVRYTGRIQVHFLIDSHSRSPAFNEAIHQTIRASKRAAVHKDRLPAGQISIKMILVDQWRRRRRTKAPSPSSIRAALAGSGTTRTSSYQIVS